MPEALRRPDAESLALAGKVAAAVTFVSMLVGPTPAGMEPAAQRMAAVTAAMAILWLTQALPIAATSLIPLVAFPLLGIMPAKEVSTKYVDHNVFLFLGGFVVALGIEKWGLHRRMALHIVRLLGTSLPRIVLGFMLATAFLSMWISNTASTLLMLPIGLAVISSMTELIDQDDGNDIDDAGAHPEIARLSVVLMLAIAYGASIGGFTTLVGTPTNVTFVGIWGEQFSQKRFPGAPEFSAGEWMIAVLPLGLLMLLCAWGILIWRLPKQIGGTRLDRRFFGDKLRALGPTTADEWKMLAIFVVTAGLWIFRKPLTFGGTELVTGWGNIVADLLEGWGVTTKHLHDSTVAIGMAVLMFAIPASRDGNGRARYLMDWKTAEKLPWGILLLIGGGFAIARGFTATKLSNWIGDEFATLVGNWPAWLLVLSVCLLMTFLTELTSNVATVSAMMPIFAAAALSIGVDPRLIMIPAVISASCAFMLPIATPPNAIVFGSGKLGMGQMVRYGIVLNLLGAVLITVATFVLLFPEPVQLGRNLQITKWVMTPQWGWHALVLPQIEEQTVGVNFDLPKSAAVNMRAVQINIKLYTCPSASLPTNRPNGFGYTTYRCNMGPNGNDGMMYLNSRVQHKDILDGSSHTILFGDSRFGFWGDGSSCCARVREVDGKYFDTWWTGEDDVQFFGFGSWHGGVVHFAFADGHARSAARDTAWGIQKTKEIGFDSIDIFVDPLDAPVRERKLIKDECDRLDLPIVSVCCVAVGLIDFNPSVQRFHIDRVEQYLDLCYQFEAENLLLVLGEYIWNREVIPPAEQWKTAVDNCRRLGDYAANLDLQIALELEPFPLSLLNNIDQMVRFVDEVGHPAVQANIDVSHLVLADVGPAEVAQLKNKAIHVHISDCDGKVHGDLPPGRGVVDFPPYLDAIKALEIDGTISIELEYSPEPDKIEEWVREAYQTTDALLQSAGLRG
eukprot:g26523.t1